MVKLNLQAADILLSKIVNLIICILNHNDPFAHGLGQRQVEPNMTVHGNYFLDCTCGCECDY
jgi:hypothetical protein